MVPARRMNPLPSWIPTPLSDSTWSVTPTGVPSETPRSPRSPLGLTCPVLTPFPADRRRSHPVPGPHTSLAGPP